MHKGNLLILVGIVALVIGAAFWLKRSEGNVAKSNHDVIADNHPGPLAASAVPAHFTAPPNRDSLGPTLPAEEFVGKTREAYNVARAIPTTLAQLPCYCHCDRGMGHKSLHSCFEDDHAAHCAVCVDEALLAYKLETEEKLTPAQIREVIIKKYAAAESAQ